MSAANEIIIDAKNAILGRLASYAAKQSLLGKKVIVVNCKDALLAGKPRAIINNYKEKRAKGGASRKGPFFPKSPEKIVKRTIRGMLSYRQERGRTALERIKCYDETPEEYESSGKVKAGKEKTVKTINLGDLSEEI